ncbi:thiamine phosphate synthase [Aliidiomarina sp. Khilg15.8]
MRPPIAWTIAGSDSGGGAGIQADIAAMRAFNTHPCSVITALTAQNSVQVTAVEGTSTRMLQAQLDALAADLPPQAIKIGMLASVAQVDLLADFLSAQLPGVPVVLDPVAVSTSGSMLAEDNVMSRLRKRMLSCCDLVTPNIPELILLTGINITDQQSLAQAAMQLLEEGASAVLVKGGHASWQGDEVVDSFFSASMVFSLRQPRQLTEHTHGTGCSLASSIAAAMACDYPLEDAIILASAYVAQGLRAAVKLGNGPGPVAHTSGPPAAACFPALQVTKPSLPAQPTAGFAGLTTSQRGLYPVVDNTALLQRVLECGVRTAQLRIKAEAMELPALSNAVQEAVALGRRYRAQVFINDHWQLALKHGAYGVHLGQEDLEHADLGEIQRAQLRLGVSTHGYFELLRAMAIRPSYIALGHVFPTPTKAMKSAPQGLTKLAHYVTLAKDFPTVAIGGIDQHNAADVYRCGVNSVAVVRAVSEAEDLKARVEEFNHA